MSRARHSPRFAYTWALAAAAAEEKVLNVFTWPDYIAPDTIANFEAEYGIKVNYDTYDSTEMAEARLLAGRTGYDVVDHAERYSARLIPIGVYQPLDRSQADQLAQSRPLGAQDARGLPIRATATACPTCGAPPASLTTSR